MKYHQPTNQPDIPDASFVNGNPALGIQGSTVPAEAIELPQREIINFMSDCGIVGTDADLHQLAEAVQSSRVHFAVDIGTSANTIIAHMTPSVKQLFVGLTVRIKIANMNGTVANYAPEYEDCRTLAEAQHVPLRTVMQEAIQEYLRSGQKPSS